MWFLRLYLVIAGLALAGSLVLGLLLRDARWFRFAGQLLRFSLILLVVLLALWGVARLLAR